MTLMANRHRLVVYPPSQGLEKARDNSGNPPSSALQLHYVHGLRSRQMRNCLVVNGRGDLVSMAGTLGVVLDLSSNTQSFFRTHDAPLSALCLHPDGLLVASGQTASRVFQERGHGGQGMVCVWASSERPLLHKVVGKGIEEMSYGVTALTFSPQTGVALAALLSDPRNTILVWKVPSTHETHLTVVTTVTTADAYRNTILVWQVPMKPM
jgi:WD40 repeat protein